MAMAASASNKGLPHTLVMENVTPATRLLEKRRQMFEVQESLEVQKAEFNRREEGLRKREDALKKKDLELQESLVKFSKFLQENDSKWTRAEKKATDEIRSRLQKEEEIRVLSKALEDLRQQQQLASNLVENSLRYQKYLEQVLDITEEHHEIGDLLDRHATLEATNTDLRQQQKATADENEQTRAELQAYSKMKADEILNQNNQVSRLKQQLEMLQRDCMILQSTMDHSLAVASQKQLEHGQVNMATQNLFIRCREKSKLQHKLVANPLAQLTMIGDFMQDLGGIVKSWQRMQAERAVAAGQTRAQF